MPAVKNSGAGQKAFIFGPLTKIFTPLRAPLRQSPPVFRPISQFIAAAFALGCVWGAALPAQATVVVFQDMATMAKKSDVIAHVVVRDQKVEEEASGRLITLTTLEVLESFKGTKTGEVLTLFQVGGELGGRRQWISGAHTYAMHEQMVLFGVVHKGRVLSYGIGLGKFKVEGEGESAIIREDITDVVAARPGPSGKMEMHKPTARSFSSMGAMRSAIQEALKPQATETLQPKQVKRLKAIMPLQKRGAGKIDIEKRGGNEEGRSQ
jgi:hypothetical protein